MSFLLYHILHLCVYFFSVDPYYFVSPAVFGNASLSEGQKLAALRDKLNVGEDVSRETLENAVDAAAEAMLHDFLQLNLSKFSRIYGSHIYISNMANELRVKKIDENGNPITEGAEFGIYENADASGEPVAAGMTDENGYLLFSPLLSGSAPGKAQAFLTEGKTYYLKEIKAPVWYSRNEEIIAVKVTGTGVYADAGNGADGISVWSGIGKVAGTMTRYAAEGDVNSTLRDIRVTYQTAEEESGGNLVFSDKSEGDSNNHGTINMHYGLNTALLEYGAHEPDTRPYFVTESGWGRAGVSQNYQYHNNPEDPYYSDANQTDLRGKELSALFTGSTTVVVENVSVGSLSIKKIVENHIETSEEQKFIFKISLYDLAGNPVSAEFLCETKDISGIDIPGNPTIKFENGMAEIQLSHNLEIMISGIPAGFRFDVTEEEANGYEQISAKGTTGAIVHKQIQRAEFVNKKINYTLPDTGGTGTMLYVLSGAFTALSGMLWLLLRHRLKITRHTHR